MLLRQILVIACAAIAPSYSTPMHGQTSEASHLAALPQDAGGLVRPGELHVRVEDPAGATAVAQVPHRETHLATQVDRIERQKIEINRRLCSVALLPALMNFMNMLAAMSDSTLPKPFNSPEVKILVALVASALVWAAAAAPACLVATKSLRLH